MDLPGRMDQRLIAAMVVLMGLVLTSLLFHTATADRRISMVDQYNLVGEHGSGLSYDITLVNGTVFVYSQYTRRHPDCGFGRTNHSYLDCSEYGEPDTDAGFGAAERLYVNGSGILVDDRRLTVWACLDVEENRIYSCPPSPVQLVSLPVWTTSMWIGGTD